MTCINICVNVYVYNVNFDVKLKSLWMIYVCVNVVHNCKTTDLHVNKRLKMSPSVLCSQVLACFSM